MSTLTHLTQMLNLTPPKRATQRATTATTATDGDASLPHSALVKPLHDLLPTVEGFLERLSSQIFGATAAQLKFGAQIKDQIQEKLQNSKADALIAINSSGDTSYIYQFVVENEIDVPDVYEEGTWLTDPSYSGGSQASGSVTVGQLNKIANAVNSYFSSASEAAASELIAYQYNYQYLYRIVQLIKQINSSQQELMTAIINKM